MLKINRRAYLSAHCFTDEVSPRQQRKQSDVTKLRDDGRSLRSVASTTRSSRLLHATPLHHHRHPRLFVVPRSTQVQNGFMITAFTGQYETTYHNALIHVTGRTSRKSVILCSRVGGTSPSTVVRRRAELMTIRQYGIGQQDKQGACTCELWSMATSPTFRLIKLKASD